MSKHASRPDWMDRLSVAGAVIVLTAEVAVILILGATLISIIAASV